MSIVGCSVTSSQHPCAAGGGQGASGTGTLGCPCLFFKPTDFPVPETVPSSVFLRSLSLSLPLPFPLPSLSCSLSLPLPSLPRQTPLLSLLLAFAPLGSFCSQLHTGCLSLSLPTRSADFAQIPYWFSARPCPCIPLLRSASSPLLSAWSLLAVLACLLPGAGLVVCLLASRGLWFPPECEVFKEPAATLGPSLGSPSGGLMDALGVWRAAPGPAREATAKSPVALRKPRQVLLAPTFLLNKSRGTKNYVLVALVQAEWLVGQR